MLRAEVEAELKHVLGPKLPIIGEIIVSGSTSVAELARLLGQKPFKIIADLMEIGVFANVNHLLNFETVCRVARKYGYAAKNHL